MTPHTQGYERLASDSINTFSNMSDAVHPTIAAADCMACEATVDAGIDAFRNIQRHDYKAQQAALRGLLVLPEDYYARVGESIKKWLSPVSRVLEWTKQCEDNGLKIQNLPEFLECVEEANAILNFNPDAEIAEGIRELEQDALAEYQRGETTEFFSEAESDD